MESVLAWCDGVRRASKVRAENGGGTRLPLIGLPYWFRNPVAASNCLRARMCVYAVYTRAEMWRMCVIAHCTQVVYVAYTMVPAGTVSLLSPLLVKGSYRNP